MSEKREKLRRNNDCGELQKDTTIEVILVKSKSAKKRLLHRIEERML
jgi:hypothetical protein